MTDLIARLTALRGECEQRPICEDYAYQAIRHINRNCDMQCESHADGSECVEWDRYDGTALAVLWNEWPAILHALKVNKAAEAYVSENPPLFLQLDSEMYYECCHCQSTARSENDVRHRDECPWVALVAAVKGEQG